MRTFATEIEKRFDSVAQLVEQMTLNHWVESSSLSGVTKQSIFSAAFFIIPKNRNFVVLWKATKRDLENSKNRWIRKWKSDERQISSLIVPFVYLWWEYFWALSLILVGSS